MSSPSVVKAAAAKGVGGWWEDLSAKTINWILGAIWTAGTAAAIGAAKMLQQDWPAAVLIGVALASLLIEIWLLVVILRRLITRVDTLAVAAPTTPVAAHADSATTTTEPLLYSRRGSEPHKAIGVVRNVAIQHELHGQEVRFVCTCFVEFFGLVPGVKCSPSELRLTAFGGRTELAKLEAPQVLIAPNTMLYTGAGTWKSLMTCVEQTMSPEHYGTTPPWRTLPPQRGMFCNLEVHLPQGHSGDTHKESPVRLDFELSQAGHHTALVQIH